MDVPIIPNHSLILLGPIKTGYNRINITANPIDLTKATFNPLLKLSSVDISVCSIPDIIYLTKTYPMKIQIAKNSENSKSI